MRIKKFNGYSIITFSRSGYRIAFNRAVLNVYEGYEELEFFMDEKRVHSEPANIFFREVSGDNFDYSEKVIDRR